MVDLSPSATMAQNQSLTRKRPMASFVARKKPIKAKTPRSGLVHPGARALAPTGVVGMKPATTIGENSGSGCIYKEDSGYETPSCEDLSDDDYSEDEEPMEAGGDCPCDDIYSWGKETHDTPSQPRKHATPAPLTIHIKRRRVSVDSTTGTLPHY
jgi:hypothetical protein